MLTTSASPRQTDIFIVFTYLLTPWSRVLLEKLASLQLVKKFPAFYGTRRFLTALPSTCHMSLSWASPIQSSHANPTSWRSILMLSSHLRLGLPCGLFPSGFPTSTLYTPLPSPIRVTCHAHSLFSLTSFKQTVNKERDRAIDVQVKNEFCSVYHNKWLPKRRNVC